MLEIRVSLDRDDIDPESLERLHGRLRTSLDGSGLERIQPVYSEIEVEGARGVKEILFGIYTGVLGNAATEALKRLARSIGDFNRRTGCQVTIEIRGDKITIDKPDDAHIERLLTHYIAETTARGDN